MTGITLWSTLATLCAILGAHVLSTLRKDPFRRLLLTQVDRAGWEAPPDSVVAGVDLDRVRDIMSEIRQRVPFFEGGVLEVDHPAYFLPEDLRERISSGRDAPTVACGTYSQLLSHALLEEGIPARVVISHRLDSNDGHVMVEAFIPEEGGWIFLDPLYDAVVRDLAGRLLGAAGVRDSIRTGSEVEILQGPAVSGQPLVASGRLLQALEGGILERIVAVQEDERQTGGSPPLFPRGLALSDGGSAWWLRTQRLQVLSMILPVVFLVFLLLALASAVL